MPRLVLPTTGSMESWPSTWFQQTKEASSGREVTPKSPEAAPTGVRKGAELISLTAAETQHPAFHSEFYHWVTRS